MAVFLRLLLVSAASSVLRLLQCRDRAINSHGNPGFGRHALRIFQHFSVLDIV